MATDNSNEEMLYDIKVRLGEDNQVNDEVIQSLIADYTTIVCNETYYESLPKNFIPYVKSAVIESCQRLGHEGMSSRSELSVTTGYSYKDIEESIRSKVKGKKNPKAFLGYWG
jgi:hypothetical protein